MWELQPLCCCSRIGSNERSESYMTGVCVCVLCVRVCVRGKRWTELPNKTMIKEAKISNNVLNNPDCMSRHSLSFSGHLFGHSFDMSWILDLDCAIMSP